MVPFGGATNPQVGVLQQLAAMIQAAQQQKQQQAQQQQMGATTPQPQAAPPIPQVGNLPQGPQFPASTTGAVASMGQAQPRPMKPPLPMSPATQNNFPNRRARSGQITTNMINSLVQMVNRADQTAEQRKIIEAQNIYSNLINAINTGDNQTRDMILNDKRSMKIVKDGLPGALTIAQPDTEPPSPEQKGLMGALKKIMQKATGNQPPQQPQGQIQRPQPTAQAQSQAIAQNEQLNRLKSDPLLRQQAGTGSMLTGQQQLPQQLQNAGLAFTPTEQYKLGSGMTSQYNSLMMAYYKANMTLQGIQARDETLERVSAARDLTSLGSSQIKAGAETQEAQSRDDSLKYAADQRKAAAEYVADTMKAVKDAKTATDKVKTLVDARQNGAKVLANLSGKDIQDKQAAIAVKQLIDQTQQLIDQQEADQLQNQILAPLPGEEEPLPDAESLPNKKKP